jgi:hypothetical protein
MLESQLDVISVSSHVSAIISVYNRATFCLVSMDRDWLFQTDAEE